MTMPTGVDAIRDGLQVVARHGGVVEVRIPKTRQGTVSGYFDDLEALVRAVLPWDGKATIYISLNPVAPALLARAVNRLREYAPATTGDADIVRRVWLPFDYDPVRPAGISATDAEVAAARARRDDAAWFLGELGFPALVAALSGNGAHGRALVDLPNDEPARRLVERALSAVASRFSDNTVVVDTSVGNAARIWKLYGTVAVKGDATADRPHRRAALERVPSELALVDGEVLEALAALAAPTKRTITTSARVTGSTFDLVAAFTAKGWYRRALHGGKHAVTCPWAASHSGDSGITETCLFDPKSPGEPWGFDCKHLHCVDRTIRDVLAVLGLSSNGHHPPPPPAARRGHGRGPVHVHLGGAGRPLRLGVHPGTARRAATPPTSSSRRRADPARDRDAGACAPACAPTRAAFPRRSSRS